MQRVIGYIERGIADGATAAIGGPGNVGGLQTGACVLPTISPARTSMRSTRLCAGQVDVNGAQFNLLAPFGGYKQSGNGREMGRFGLEEFVEVKSSSCWVTSGSAIHWCRGWPLLPAPFLRVAGRLLRLRRTAQSAMPTCQTMLRRPSPCRPATSATSCRAD
jgi:hypothetical protein